MLHADKGAFLSSVQRDAVQLHKQELEYFMLRYVALATVSSILVGFCWMGLIKSGELFRAALGSSGFIGALSSSGLLFGLDACLLPRLIGASLRERGSSILLSLELGRRRCFFTLFLR